MFYLYGKKILKEMEYKMLLRMAREIIAKDYLRQLNIKKTN